MLAFVAQHDMQADFGQETAYLQPPDDLLLSLAYWLLPAYAYFITAVPHHLVSPHYTMSSGPERPHCDLESSPDLWRKHKATIRRLYQDERKTLREVKYEMENRGFPKKPLSTWETQLRDVLGLRKKFKKKDWVLIHQHVAQRREQGKESDILLNNTKIEWKRAWKEMRRSGKLSTQVRQGK
ncbi:hypothetical protein LA080_010547 [Diaporthe eres]|nr:hypothetical protein LA080_010547 [Diaporthe eres]